MQQTCECAMWLDVNEKGVRTPKNPDKLKNFSYNM